MQATLETVDGSRLGGFFVKVVPLGHCSGAERVSVHSCCQNAFELSNISTLHLNPVLIITTKCYSRHS